MYMQQESNQTVVQQQVQHQQWSGGTQNMGATVQSDQRVPQAFTSQSLAHLQNMQVPTNINSPYEVFQPNPSNCQDQYQQGHQVFQSGDNVYVQSYQCSEMKSEYQYSSFQNKNQNEFQMQQQNLQLYGQYENQFQPCVEQVQSEVGYQTPSESGSQYQFFVPGHGQTLPEVGSAQNFQFSSECVQSGQSVVQMQQQQETLHQQQNVTLPPMSSTSQQPSLHQQYHPAQQQEIVQNPQANLHHPGQQISHQQLISGGHIISAPQQSCPQGSQILNHPQIITSTQSQIVNAGSHTPAQPHLLQSNSGQGNILNNATGQSIITNNPGQQIITTGQSPLISGGSAHPQFVTTSVGQPQLLSGNSNQPLFSGSASAPQIIASGGQQQLITSGSTTQPQLVSSLPSQPPSLAQGTILIPVQQPGQAPLPQMIATGNGQFLIIQPNMIGPQLVLTQNQPTVQTTQLLIQTPQGLVVQPIFTLPQQTVPQVLTIPQPPAQPAPSNTCQPVIRIVPTSAQPIQPPLSQPSSAQQQRFVPPPASQESVIPVRTKEITFSEDTKGQIEETERKMKDKEEAELDIKTEGQESASLDEEGDDKSDEEEIDSKEEAQKILPPSTQPLSIQMLPRAAVPQQIFINGGVRTIISGNSETPVPGQVLPLAQSDGTTQPFVVVAQNPAVQQMIMAPPPSQSPDSTEDAGQPTINQTNAHIVDGVDLEEIKEFAKAFKMRRLSLGLTQTQIGQALSATAGPAYSQSAICRFERLDITPKSAQKIRPVLERWMKEAEEKFKQGQRELVEFVRLPGLNKIRKRRTSFSPEAVGLLSQYFEINKHPTGTEVTRLAQQLGYEREVVRIWFCNRRQAMRNAAKFVGRGKNKQVTIPEKSSDATSSPEPSMEICESPEADVSECLSPPGSTTVDGGVDESVLPD